MANNNEYNYFTQNIDKMGEDFLSLKNAKDFKRESTSIFRQLATRRINLEKYAHFFLDIQFLNSLISAAQEKHLFHRASADGLKFLIDYNACNGQQVDPFYINVLNTHAKASQAYLLIYDGLTALKNSGQIGCIYALVNKLASDPSLGNAL